MTTTTTRARPTKTSDKGSNDDSSESDSGSDDSGSDEDEDVDVAADKMKRQMEKLQRSDPEFHKFLAENENSLLEFGEDDEEEDEEEKRRLLIVVTRRKVTKSLRTPMLMPSSSRNWNTVLSNHTVSRVLRSLLQFTRLPVTSRMPTRVRMKEIRKTRVVRKSIRSTRLTYSTSSWSCA